MGAYCRRKAGERFDSDISKQRGKGPERVKEPGIRKGKVKTMAVRMKGIQNMFHQTILFLSLLRAGSKAYLTCIRSPEIQRIR